MPGTSQTYPNATLTRVLLVASRWLIFIPIITTALLLSAGTFLYNAPYRPTVLSLGLRSLAMVSVRKFAPTCFQIDSLRQHFALALTDTSRPRRPV